MNARSQKFGGQKRKCRSSGSLGRLRRSLATGVSASAMMLPACQDSPAHIYNRWDSGLFYLFLSASLSLPIPLPRFCLAMLQRGCLL